MSWNGPLAMEISTENAGKAHACSALHRSPVTIISVSKRKEILGMDCATGLGEEKAYWDLICC